MSHDVYRGNYQELLLKQRIVVAAALAHKELTHASIRFPWKSQHRQNTSTKNETNEQDSKPPPKSPRPVRLPTNLYLPPQSALTLTIAPNCTTIGRCARVAVSLLPRLNATRYLNTLNSHTYLASYEIPARHRQPRILGSSNFLQIVDMNPHTLLRKNRKYVRLYTPLQGPLQLRLPRSS